MNVQISILKPKVEARPALPKSSNTMYIVPVGMEIQIV